MRRAAVTLAALAFLVPAVACAQADAEASGAAAGRSARVDSLFARWSEPDRPGCAVVVVQDGRVVHRGLHGLAIVEHGVPIDGSTVFDLASLSKHATAAAVALLVEDGKVGWDDPVRRWVPELPPIYAPVRVRDLVHHTSGVREYFTLWAMAGRDVESTVEDEEVLAMLERQGQLDFPPGARESYSNSNYFLLARIVGLASEMSLDAFLRERLFGPLGMTATRFVDDHEDILPRLAESYFEKEDGTLARRVLKHDVVGPSGLSSTIDDMARWAIALLSDEGPAAGLLATLTERGALADGTRIAYARGLRVMPMRGLETVSHGGTMGGFRTYMVLVPDREWGTVVLCNQLEASPFQLTGAITDIWFAGEMAPLEVGNGRVGPPETPPSGDLPPLDVVGRWWSEELSAHHELIRADDGLAVRRGELPPDTLTVVSNDRLAWGGITWRIERGAGGRPERIVLESERVSGIVLVPAHAAPTGPRLVVPRGSAPRLDGRLGEEEWSAGAPVELDARGHARFLHDGARLYVAIQGPEPGWSHVYLAWGDTVRVLHASAALGSVRYVLAPDGAWHTDEEFVYTLRDTSLSETAVAGRERYLAEHGWVATLFGMGAPGAQEYAIDLARLGPDVRIAVLQASDAARPTTWPTLADDTRHPVLARGDAVSPVSFESETWAGLELEK